MVRARALIHDVPRSRATSDVDVTISLLRNGGVRYQQFEELLRSVDFQPDGNTRLCYRYRRGRDIVDLMFRKCRDRVPSQ